MEFLEIIADLETGIKALIALLPSIGSFVDAVHPAAGQEAAKVTTAVTAATQVLTAVGVTATTISSLVPVVTAAVNGNNSTAVPITSVAALATTS